MTIDVNNTYKIINEDNYYLTIKILIMTYAFKESIKNQDN